jgi:hypothetical protein
MILSVISLGPWSHDLMCDLTGTYFMNKIFKDFAIFKLDVSDLNFLAFLIMSP